MATSSSSGSLLDYSLADSSVALPIRVAAVALAVTVTAAAAQCTMPLPFTAVPFVLTPLAVLLAGAALGSRLGSISQAVYILAGVSGLPVFAPSAALPPGLLRMVGPTGGYLMAYPIAAFVTGWLAERGWDRRYGSSCAAMLIGLAVIYAGGVSWYAVSISHALMPAVRAAAQPFVALDVLKVAAAAAILPQAWRLLGPARPLGR